MEGEFEPFNQFVFRTENREARVDDWNDYCEGCDGKGGLLMCMGCNLVYHERCVVAKVISGGLKRNEELVCPSCIQDLRVKQ